MEQLTNPINKDDQDHQWSSLNLHKADEEEAATFMAQLFNSTTLDPFMATIDDHNLHDQVPFEIMPSNSSSFYMLNSQESSDHELSGGNYCSQLLLPTHQNYDHNMCNSMNFYLENQLGNYDNGGCFNFNLEDHEDSMNLKACFGDELIKLPYDLEKGHEKIIIDINCKKRSRGCGDVQKKSNIERSKKIQKLTSISNTQEDGNDAGHGRQSTSTYCSEDELNASLELNGGANNLGSSSKEPIKSRASRGLAKDPQSMYARKRRERINERLKVLQNLVPNGTKVDLSTMLEEAVQYVKFLQLQIKLLSSDNLWMYAPIAYNGMNIGLNPTPNTPKES